MSTGTGADGAGIDAVIAMRDVTKRYGSFTALDGVSVALRANTIHGLLGRNGAGKTTMMQLLTAQNFATAGSVEIFGEKPYENARVLSRTCFIREALKYPENYRLHHALRAGEMVYPNWDAAFAESLAEEFGVPRKRAIKKLSRGQLSAVGVIIGLASRAPLTFFDEPYLGLDAVARQLFYDRLLVDYAEHPRTVVLSTHLIDEVSDLIEHVLLIDKGRILIDEDAEVLRGRAVTVTGPVQAVESFAAGHTELHREQMGGFLRVTLSGASGGRVETEPALGAQGLEFEPVSLQQLVVRTTQNNVGVPDTDLVVAGPTNRKVLS